MTEPKKISMRDLYSDKNNVKKEKQVNEIWKKNFKFNPIASGVNNNINNNLMKAVFMDDTDSAKLLIANGADVNYKEKQNNGTTPLQLAITGNHYNMALLLINSGAIVNLSNDNNRTAIEIICNIHNLEYSSVAKLLIDNQADISKCDPKEIKALIEIANTGDGQNNNDKIYVYLNKILNGNKKISLAIITPDQYNDLNNYTFNTVEKFLNILSGHVGCIYPRIQIWRGNYISKSIAHYENGFITIKEYQQFNGKNIAGILAHEFTHYYIDLKKINWVYGDDLNRYEKLVDAAAILLGFGEIIINGKSVSHEAGNSSIGYLNVNECLNVYSFFQKINLS